MTEKERTYKAKNEQLTVWIPKDVKAWFIDYLKRKSVGSSTGERFRQFLYAIQTKEKTGITAIAQQLNKPQPLTQWICVRELPKHSDPMHAWRIPNDTRIRGRNSEQWNELKEKHGTHA